MHTDTETQQLAVETSKHFTLNDATNYVSHVTNMHVHYSTKVSKKQSIVSLSDSMVNLSA